MFTNLISRIHDRSQPTEILQAGVDSVKQFLNCDRAVVYSLQPDSLGKIVAEAVDAAFPKTMETIIDDPCFEARYIDTYSKGRISAIDDLRAAKITPCHLENLERLAVKANLVVPVLLPEGELYGLLILHQCSRTRVWQQAEIALVAQMASQIGWALANAVRWDEYRDLHSSIDRQHQYDELLATATQTIHQGNTRAEVFQIATAQAQSVLKCDRAIVYTIDPPNLGTIVAESTLAALAPIHGLTIEDPCFEERYIPQYQQGRVQAIDNIYESGMSDLFVENLVKIAVKANVVVPILGSQDRLFGLLVVHQCFNYRDWEPMEVEWLRQLGIQTGFALTKAQYQEDVAAMKSSLRRASMVKVAIASTDTQMQHVKAAVRNTAQTLEEAKHLLRLLNHEVAALTDKVGSEDINLVRIITKKLQNNAEIATTGTHSLQSELATLEAAIDSAIQVYKSRKFS